MHLGWSITPVQKRSVATPFIFLWSPKSSEKPLWQWCLKVVEAFYRAAVAETWSDENSMFILEILILEIQPSIYCSDFLTLLTLGFVSYFARRIYEQIIWCLIMFGLCYYGAFIYLFTMNVKLIKMINCLSIMSSFFDKVSFNHVIFLEGGVCLCH